MPDIIIYLDMDEVLVDFVGGACAAHGWTREQFEKVRTPGVWSMPEFMGLSLDEFWEPIHAAGENFWFDLNPTPWCKEVIELAEEYSKEWHIVTAPSRCETSYTGKVRWLKSYFGPQFNNFVITPHKHILAQEHTWLIDDREKNVESFCEDGGNALCFPNLGNNLHAYHNDPVGHLRSLDLETYFFLA